MTTWLPARCLLLCLATIVSASVQAAETPAQPALPAANSTGVPPAEPVLIPPPPETVPLPSTLLPPHMLSAAPAPLPPPADGSASLSETEIVPPGTALADAIDDPVLAPPKLWCGRIEAGVTGAEGNTQLFQTRFGAKAARETPNDKLKFDLFVARAENFGELTENKAILEVNNDWNLDASRWAWFVNQMTEYDEFRNFDVRLSLHTGLTFHALKGRRGFLDLRGGVGTSREVGSPQNEFLPETKLGFDTEFKVAPRQKLTGSTDAFIDVSDPSDMRVNSRAGYALLLDADRNLNLELGILNRYDSSPNGAKPNDLDYNLLFFWEF